MNFAQEMYVRSVAGLSRCELGERMRQTERLQGFTIVTDAPWLDWSAWDEATIISRDGGRIRLVALQAKQPGNGAFTRLIRGIFNRRLIPVLVEPNQSLINWCVRHNFRHKRIGNGAFRHDVWYPRRATHGSEHEERNARRRTNRAGIHREDECHRGRSR